MHAQAWDAAALEVNAEPVQNALYAFGQNQSFFSQLTSPERRRNDNCAPNPLYRLEELRGKNAEELRDMYKRHVQLSTNALLSYGTLEYRLKEADAYWDALGFLQFATVFTVEAAQNPDIKAQDVLKKYGLEVEAHSSMRRNVIPVRSSRKKGLVLA